MKVRPNIADVIHDYYQWATTNRVAHKPSLAALYFFLVNTCDLLKWPQEFSVSAKECMEGMGVSSYNTYKNTFDALCGLGFVEVKQAACNHYQAYIVTLSHIDWTMQAAEVPQQTQQPSPQHQQHQPIQAELFTQEELPPPSMTPEQQAKADKARKYKYADNVTLTRDEYARLCEQHGEQPAKRMIEILDNYKGSKGKRYKSDYKAILSWVVDKYNEEIMKYGTERQTNQPNNGGGSENNQRRSAEAIQAESGTGGTGEAKASKDYSERF